MRNDIEKRAKVITKKKLFNAKWKKVVTALACVSVFWTTYALILPAITASVSTYCGQEEHIHDEDCYMLHLTCGMEEGQDETRKTDAGHTHTDACYTHYTELTCKLDETAKDAGHTHGSNCYETVTTINEANEEVSEQVLICGQQEREATEGHSHKDSCYTTVKTLYCEETEREASYETLEGSGHIHSDSCYEKEFTCTKQEHKHSEECYSDKTADLESAVTWEKTLPDQEEYTGVWVEDMLLIAKSQLGYKESTKNFVFEDGRRKGYTRYGALKGVPYGDWCAMYIQFCLHYAGVDPELFPSNPSCRRWAAAAEEMDNFFTPDEYVPNVGDIIFFDYDGSGITNHIGIVTDLIYEETENEETGVKEEVLKEIETIEGNSSDTVRYNTYKIDDECIYGYTVVPEKPEDYDETSKEIPEEEETESATVSLATYTETGVRVEFSAPREAFAEDVKTSELWLAVEEIRENDDSYSAYAGKAEEKMNSEFAEINKLRLFDITVMDSDNKEVKWANESLASVQIILPDGETMGQDDDKDISVIHFNEDGTEMDAEILDSKMEDEVVTFETPSFSVFGVAETSSLTSKIITAEGKAFTVTVTYSQNAEIPEGATLSLTEYKKDTEEYASIRELQESKLQAQREAYIEENLQSTLEEFQSRENIEIDGMETGTPDEAAVRELLGMVFDEHMGINDLALIDISILDPNGIKVEPAAPVDVQIVMTELPEDVTPSDVASTLRVNHIVEQENGDLVPELVANAAGEEGKVEIVMDPAAESGNASAVAEFTVDGFSFYTIGWDQQGGSSNQRFTVYYGYEVRVTENGVAKDYFHEFGNQIQRPSNGYNDATGANAEYHLNKAAKTGNMLSGTDFANYKYKRAYVRHRNGDIYTLTSGPNGDDPVVYGTGNGFKVKRWDGHEITLSNADEIYVVYETPHNNGLDYNYEDRNTATNTTRGGSQVNPNPTGGDVDLGEPAHTKTLTENVSDKTDLFDNTYELTLTATGNSAHKENHTKADIIIIWDKSGSMRQAHGNNPPPHEPLTDAAINLVNEITAATEDYPESVEYTLIRYNHEADLVLQGVTGQRMITELRGMKSNPYWHYGYATNWEDGLAKAAAINTRKDAKQYVIFITDGKPSLRNTRGSQYAENNWHINNITSTGNGPYMRTDEWTYVKNGNGVWSWVSGKASGTSGSLYGDTGNHSDNAQANVNTAIDLARSIGEANMQFFGIGIATAGEDMTNQMNQIISASGGTGTIAKNTEEILAVFDPVIEAVIKDYEYQFMEINDNLSATTETVLVDTPGDFKYYKYFGALPTSMPEGFSVISETTGERVVVDASMWNNMRNKGNAPGNFPGRDKEYLFNVILNATDENGNYYIDQRERYLPYGKVWEEMTLAEKEPYKWNEAPAAVYTASTGKVEWNLQALDVEKGMTYAVAFTVYPNQDGWDRITDLKNHANDPDFDWSKVNIDYVKNQDGSVDLFEQIYEDGVYKGHGTRPLLSLDAQGNVKIASNDQAELKYRQKTTTTDQSGSGTPQYGEIKTATYKSPYMSVEPSSVNLRKIWKDTLVPRWPINEVDLEIWYVSRGNGRQVIKDGVTMYEDADTHDLTDKTEIAYVDDNNVTWYWSSKYEELHLSETDDFAGYINIYEGDESVTGLGATIITAEYFDELRSSSESGLHIDDEHYLMNGSEFVTNSKGHKVQYFAFWETESSIAPGLVATNIKADGSPLTGAEGHFYAFREDDTSLNQGEQFTQHFELDSTVIRPMKRDGIMDENSQMLAGTNSRKGELAITKMALTQDRHEINPDVPFQVDITLTDSRGNPLMMDSVEGQDPVTGEDIISQRPRNDIEYVVYDSGGNVVDIDSITGSTPGSYEIKITKEQIDGEAATADWHKTVPYDASSRKHHLVFSKLYADWTIVFVNLPSGAKWTVQETFSENAYSNGYVFEGYTLPEGKRGHDTLHPQPHFLSDRVHYSGGTVDYDEHGNIIETNLIKVTDFDNDPLSVRDVNGRLIASPDGSAAYAISGYVDADAEELIDIHNTRTPDELEVNKVDEDTNEPLAGAKFVIESLRPETIWRIHEENGVKTWVETYVFGENEDDPDSPNMTSVIGPAHHPASVHIDGTNRYVVRGDVIGILYSLPRSEWEDDYTPRPLDKDGNEITDVRWVTVPAGTDLSQLTHGVHYLTQGGVNYILRPSTGTANSYEKIVDTTVTHVYYYAETTEDGKLRDTDPNHGELLSELPIIAGDQTVYDVYEIEAPPGYMTALEQVKETNPRATWEDAKFRFTVTSGRTWDSANNRSAPYIDWYNPITRQTNRVIGQWDDTNKHWGFLFTITNKRNNIGVELKKISSNQTVNMDEPEYYQMTPTGGNPNALGLFEKEGNDYVRTKDTSPESGKTYYLALTPIPQSSADDSTVNPNESGWVRHNQIFGTSYPATPVITRNDLPVTTDTVKKANTQYYIVGSYTGDKINDITTAGLPGIYFSLFKESTQTDTNSTLWCYEGSGYAEGTGNTNYINILDKSKTHNEGNLNGKNYGKSRLTINEYSSLKQGQIGGQDAEVKIDETGYLVYKATGARVKNTAGTDILYVKNAFAAGKEKYLVPAENLAGTELKDLVTDKNGNLDFGNLPVGTYYLFEHASPAAYADPKGVVIIEVSSKGVKYNQIDNISSQNTAITRTEADGKTVYTLVITNTPDEMTLPMTGGPGTLVYTLIGITLMLGCAYLGYIRLKRREGY